MNKTILPEPTTPPDVVQGVDLQTLPKACVRRLAVPIAHGPLGGSVDVPVLVAKGRQPGPVLGITAAVHGNELNGIPVIHRLLERLDVAHLRGTVVAVPVVSVGALRRRQREHIDGIDLNHIFPGKPNGRGAEVYAHRFMERIAHCFEFSLDLHTASFGRINSLYVRANMREPTTADIAYLLRPQIVLHNQAGDGTLRAAMARRGVPAVTVEIGNPHRYHAEFINFSLVGIRRVMGYLGMLKSRPSATREPPVLCRSSKWLYTQHGGLLTVLPKLRQRVARGEVIATVHDVYGQLVCSYAAPHAGIVIGRSVDPVAHTGDRILHLGRIATARDEGLLRRAEFRIAPNKDTVALTSPAVDKLRSSAVGAPEEGA